MGIVHAKDNDSPPQGIIGLPDGKVNYDECEEEKVIPLDVPARVDRINVDGLSRTKNDIVEEATREIFKAKSFREVLMNAHKARQKLESLSCFRNIAVHIDVSKGPRATPDGLEVTFYVKELKQIVGGVNTEVGNNEGAIVVGLRAPNAFGRGERIFVEYSYGSRRSNNFSVGIIKPFLGKHEPRISASIFQNLSVFNKSGYKEIDRGFVLDYGFFSRPLFRHNLQYKGCMRELWTMGKTSSFDVREQSGATLKSAIQHILTIDQRDELIFPSCGSLFQFTTELAGLGGDVGFIKNDIYMQANCSVAKDFVLQGTLAFGHLKPLNDNWKVGMSDMFYLGGPLDLRGFQMRGIGPKAEGDALGCDAYWSAGLHLFTPLPFNLGKGGFGDVFRTHLFVNAGNVGSSKVDERYVDQLSQNVRVSTGIGLAVRLGQMARFELNYCFPVRFDQEDFTQQGIQFGIGVQFS